MCKLMHDMFKKLQNVDPINAMTIRVKLRKVLLKVLLQLIQPNGAFANKLGPMDAQNELIKTLLKFKYDKTDLEIAMKIIESVCKYILF